MIQIRRSADRGHAQHGWLESRHTFSFANYYDPRFTGFRDLLVINEDRVQPGQGFGMHPHRDMEIISYVLEGELAHKDSMGSGSVIRPGDVQRMSAGTGVVHSEFNHSRDHAVHFLQIWIAPETRGIAPSYEERQFAREDKSNRLKQVVSPDGADGSLTLHQDVRVYASLLEPEHRLVHELAPGRYAWLQLARGSVELNGEPLHAGDGVAISDESRLEIVGRSTAELLLLDLS
jgi:redox-sensitive bicupin YhaK (pirin superfamily)